MAFLSRVRTRKPHGAVRINFAHPLARDIAFFYYETVGVAASAATFYDAVTGRTAGVSAANTAISSTDPVGGGNTSISCNNGSAASTTTAFTNPRAINTQSLTVFARFKATAKPAVKTQILCYGAADASRNSYVGINSSGNVLGGCGTSNGMNSLADSADNTNKWVNVAGSSDGTALGVAAGWLNGVSLGTNAGGTNTGVAATTVSFGRDSANYYNSFTGEIAVAIGWNRVLTDAEHRQLSANPWQLLQPRFEAVYFNVNSGGASNPTFSIAGLGVVSPIAASAIAMAGAGALNAIAASLLVSSGVGAFSPLMTATLSSAGFGTPALVSASLLSSSGVGTATFLPAGFATFAIVGLGVPTFKSASKLAAAGVGAFNPLKYSAASPFTMSGGCTVIFIGSTFRWDQVAGASTVWTPEDEDDTAWTPSAQASSPWTRIH